MDLLAEYSSEEDEEPKRDEKRRRRGCVEVVSIQDISPDTFDRSLPHVRGNWAGHIFAPLTEDLSEQVEASIESFRKALELSGWSGKVVAQTGLHVSFSRPFFLQVASIESFQRELRAALSYERALATKVIKPIVLSNDEGTRSFFGWKLDTNPGLVRLVREIDAVMIKYKQKQYYNPPIFHISLASIHGEVPAKITSLLDPLVEDQDFESLLHLRQLSCTFGTTKRFEIALM
jgi:hypothetical protein